MLKILNKKIINVKTIVVNQSQKKIVVVLTPIVIKKV